MWFDIIGYVGAFILVLATTYTSIKQYRLLGTIGSLIFMIYGIVINNIPVSILMACLAFINFKKMLKPMSQRKYYSYVDPELDDPMLQYLLGVYKKEIKSFFPQYDLSHGINLIKVTMHDGKAVGFFLGHREGDKCIIEVDYSIPKYRDHSVGKYLYPELKKMGINTLILEDKAIDHDKFLREMGFVKKGSSFIKDLTN